MGLYHHQSDYAFHFDRLQSGDASHILIPDQGFKRGDRIHLTNTVDGAEVWRDIVLVTRDHMFAVFRESHVSLGLLHPAVNRLTQFSLTNERGQTSVFWLGDHRDLPVGTYLTLFDNPSDWRIESRWTSLLPKDVPDCARVGFVKEIFHGAS